MYRVAQPSVNRAAKLIARFRLSLHGLTVLTEAASGPYLANAALAGLAGANVLAFTKTTRFGKRSEVWSATQRLARQWGVGQRIHRIEQLSRDVAGAADIVTNSGHLRPLDARFIRWMKPTAVIPMMWETWEFRGIGLDLDAARRRGILVLGTREDRSPCDMRPYSTLFATKLLFECGLAIYGTHILVVGGQHTLGVQIANGLKRLGARVTWCGDYPGVDYRLAKLGAAHRAIGKRLDAILVCEHVYSKPLIGSNGLLTPRQIAGLTPELTVAVISGRVETEKLRALGIKVMPDNVLSDGRMSYQASELGAQPVNELFVAGLKVGEEMAKARIAGLSTAAAARRALSRSPAMDFPGERSWIKKT